MKFRKIQWVLLAVGAGLTSLALVLSLSSAPPTEPKITWSESQVEVILSPGESTSRELTFTSSRDLQNAAIEPVPEVAPFLQISPNTFLSVPANQPQLIRFYFLIPAKSSLGAFDGTIHVRQAGSTIPATLKVTVRLWQSLNAPSLNLAMRIPPGLTAEVTDGATLADRKVVFREEGQPVLPHAGLFLQYYPIGSDQSVEDLLRSIGDDPSSFQTLIINGRMWIRSATKWGDEAISYTTRVSSTTVLTVTAISDDFKSSPDFLVFIESIAILD